MTEIQVVVNILEVYTIYMQKAHITIFSLIHPPSTTAHRAPLQAVLQW